MASRNVQMPTTFTPLTGGNIITQDWASFLQVVQQITFALTLSGTTADRPTSLLPGRWIGMPYLDTDLAIPIWLLSVSPDVWIDATGAVV